MRLLPDPFPAADPTRWMDRGIEFWGGVQSTASHSILTDAKILACVWGGSFWASQGAIAETRLLTVLMDGAYVGACSLAATMTGAIVSKNSVDAVYGPLEPQKIVAQDRPVMRRCGQCFALLARLAVGLTVAGTLVTQTQLPEVFNELRAERQTSSVSPLQLGLSNRLAAGRTPTG